MGTCGIAAGAREIMSALIDELAARELSDVTISQTGCKGLCDREPMIEVHATDMPVTTYCGLTPQAVRRIVADHIVNGQVVTDYAVGASSEAS